MMLLRIHKDIPHMPVTELENGSESVWIKVFANKTSHFVASWYRSPDSKVEELELFKIFGWDFNLSLSKVFVTCVLQLNTIFVFI